MNKSDITSIVLNAIEMTNSARDDDTQIPVATDTALFGESGHLDSMSLVAFLIDIEESMLDEGHEISLSDERAMSQSSSPFVNVESLVNYIDSLVREPA